jgi:hypothetical protein
MKWKRNKNLKFKVKVKWNRNTNLKFERNCNESEIFVYESEKICYTLCVTILDYLINYNKK